MKLPGIATALSSYGGAKINDSPVADPVTDESADDRNEYVDDVRAMTNTAIRAWVRFNGHGTTPTDPASGGIHGAVWGSLAARPTVTRSSTGVYLVTWPTSFTDELGNVHTFNINGVCPPNVEGSTLYHANATRTSANSVTVRVYNSSNSLNDAVGATINLQVW